MAEISVDFDIVLVLKELSLLCVTQIKSFITQEFIKIHGNLSHPNVCSQSCTMRWKIDTFPRFT